MGFLFGINYLFSIGYELLVYVLSAYSLYLIARRNNVRFPYLAFVPIVQYSIIGSICEEYVLRGYRIRRLSIVICLLFLVQAACNIATSAAAIPFSIASTALLALIMHKFFYLFKPQNALFFAVITLLGPLPLAIVLFLVKDAPMQMSAGAYPYPFADK